MREDETQPQGPENQFVQSSSSRTMVCVSDARRSARSSAIASRIHGAVASTRRGSTRPFEVQESAAPMTTSRRALKADQVVVRRLLGFGILLLIVVSGYVASHLRVANQVPRLGTNASAPTIESHIKEAASQYAVSEDLVTAVIEVESQFNVHAVSHRGAQGLMQLMPATAASLGVRNAFDARENIRGGVRHLRLLMDRFDHDLPVVLAAYNAGEGAVLKSRGVPPSRETREYVKRGMQRMNRDRVKS